MRLTLAAILLALSWSAAAVADDWGEIAQVSTTMGIRGIRICIGEGSRGDLGCPADTPTVTGSTISGTFIDEARERLALIAGDCDFGSHRPHHFWHQVRHCQQ